MHFRSAYLKLTAFYVLIAMAISVAFSVYLFKMSSREVDRGLGKQASALRDIAINKLYNQPFPDLEKIQADQINESENRLKLNLFYFNLLILVLSGGASYFLARRTLQPIEEAVEAQNRFTADASHELRTPLTAMKTEIEVALRDKNISLQETRNLLKSNLEETEKLESLSNALLKLARYQENDHCIWNNISIVEVITEAYSKLESLAQKKSIEFENNLRDFDVLGDRNSLIELFVILIDNAIKYSPEMSKIFISIRNEGEMIAIKIRDQGMGIKQSDLPYIFNRFYRADLSRSRENVHGYGLGLSIAKKIAEAHKGSIAVSSKLGSGTEFIIRLRGFEK